MDYRLNVLFQAAYCCTELCSGMSTVPLRPEQKLGETLRFSYCVKLIHKTDCAAWKY